MKENSMDVAMNIFFIFWINLGKFHLLIELGWNMNTKILLQN
jgi:hypothetical protein